MILKKLKITAVYNHAVRKKKLINLAP